MKTGKTLVELAQELTNQMNERRDMTAPAEMLSVSVEDAKPVLNVGDKGSFSIGEVAHEQIADRLDIPRKYANRMASEAPALFAQNVNHWFGSSSNKSSYLVRTLGNKARALLSDRFRCLDNYDLADMAIPQLSAVGARVESCEVTERRFYLKAVTERLSFDVSNKPGVGDVVQAGIVISNSEVGAGALSVEPLIYRLRCLNGAIMPDSGMRRAHLGGVMGNSEGVQDFYKDETMAAADKAFWMQVRDIISAFFDPEKFSKLVEKFRAARGDIIEVDPVKVVEVTAKRYSLSESEKNGVLVALLRDGDMDRFGLANAITYTAQQVESYDRATELERLGGSVFELPKRDWSSLMNESRRRIEATA